MIHRDLKPENVFLLERRGSPRFVKLVDFGIAKLASRAGGAARVTGAGVIVGTPEYMAPEQAEFGHADARTDVYALGVLAYQLGTGVLPFTGAEVTQVLIAHLQQAPRPPRQLAPGLPPAFEAAVLRAMAKRPEERFQDMAAFTTALEEVRQLLVTPSEPSRGVAEVTWRGAPPTSWRAHLITRGGLFLAGEKAPPPLLEPVSIALDGEGAGRLTLRAQVVQVIARGAGAGWGLGPGFAVVLAESSPESQAALERTLGRATPAAGPGAGGRPGSLTPAKALAELAALEARAAEGVYELLDLPPGADFTDVRAAARALRARIDDLRPLLPPADQVTRAPELLARLDAAASLLGTSAERLMFDARRGNFRGVARCITAGVPAAVLAARREALLGEQPERAAQARRQLALAQVATRLGNTAAALRAIEAALAADPLDTAALDTWRELSRQGR